MTARTYAGILGAFAILSVAAANGQGGGKPVTGNPTPGTVQPEPPNLADRVTFVGCVRAAPTVPGETTDANTPSRSHFVLDKAERQNVVPPGTGGSPLAQGTAGTTLRLEAIDSQLSPFAGSKVEISGEIVKPEPARSSDKSTADRPTLRVEFVRRLAAGCS